MVEVFVILYMSGHAQTELYRSDSGSDQRGAAVAIGAEGQSRWDMGSADG